MLRDFGQHYTVFNAVCRPTAGTMTGAPTLRTAEVCMKWSSGKPGSHKFRAATCYHCSNYGYIALSCKIKTLYGKAKQWWSNGAGTEGKQLQQNTIQGRFTLHQGKWITRGVYFIYQIHH